MHGRPNNALAAWPGLMYFKVSVVNHPWVMEPRFIDRVAEISWLKDWSSGFRYVPLYIYGPEGCGKTRLLREFVVRFNQYFGDDGIAVYVDATEGVDLNRALLTSPNTELVIDVVRELISGFVSEGVGEGGDPGHREGGQGPLRG